MGLDARYIVGPVRRALQLLDVLADAGRAMTLTELADRTGLPKTTAFRYLYTLRSARLVAGAEGTDAYLLGPRLAAVPAPDAAIELLKQAAAPQMRNLQHRFNETVNLGVSDGQEITYVAMAGSTRSLRMEASIGARDPLHSTSLGKAILADRPVETRLEGLPARLARRTEHTLITRLALEADLAQTVTRGYALDLQENELGAQCVAAVIPTTLLPAAISISGPMQRLPEELLHRCGAALVRAAAAIAARM